MREFRLKTIMAIHLFLRAAMHRTRSTIAGLVYVVWKQKGTMGNLQAGTSGIPSPDGRHLAMMGYTYNANMWTLEDF
jgi:hypothetical protein